MLRSEPWFGYPWYIRMDRDIGRNNLGHLPTKGAANRCIRNIGSVRTHLDKFI